MARDELSFEEMMAAQGVRQMAGGAGRPFAAPRSSGPARPGAPGTPAPPPARELLRAQSLLGESETARVALVAQVGELNQELADLRVALAAAEALRWEADALRAQAEESLARTDAARDALVRERDEARIFARQEASARTSGESRLATTLAARRSVADALTTRGCADESEMLEVVNGLMLQRPREFLGSLVLADPHELDKVLAERVAFVWSGAGFTPDKNTVVLGVDKARCEICAGSDIKASFHGFVQACLDGKVRDVTIVGGSPAYRRQLETLALDVADAPKLNLVSGTRPRETRRAQADMRRSDVVVIWGATELDHSVSAGYSGGTARLIRVAHRGIARMLQLVRSELRVPGPRPPTG